MKDRQQRCDLILLLISRLERLSADSYWAHQVSGVRGSLLRLVEGREQNPVLMEKLIELGFKILEKATKEK